MQSCSGPDQLMLMVMVVKVVERLMVVLVVIMMMAYHEVGEERKDFAVVDTVRLTSFLHVQAALATEADATTEVLRAQLLEAQAKLEATAKVCVMPLRIRMSKPANRLDSRLNE